MNNKIALFLLFFFIQLNASPVIFSPVKENRNNLDAIIFGDVFADYTLHVSEEKFKLFGVKKGSWNPVDIHQFHKLLPSADFFTAGGSGINLMKGLSILGKKCGVLGKIGSDKIGKIYLEKLKKYSIQCYLKKIPLLTGRVLCVVTPDGQRTFFSYQGAAKDTNLFSFTQNVKQTTLFHIEGYQLPHPRVVRDTLKKIRNKCKWISLDLANTNIVKHYKKFIQKLIQNSVDIVFSNQEEAKELTGLSPFLACHYIAKSCKIAVVTMGEKGGWVSDGKRLLFFPAKTVQTIDSTGAGDLFASGFLFGFLNRLDLFQSAKIGALVASYIVQENGAEISEESWKKIFSELALIK